MEYYRDAIYLYPIFYQYMVKTIIKTMCQLIYHYCLDFHTVVIWNKIKTYIGI